MKHWTKDELEYVKNNYLTLSLEELSLKLNRSEIAIYKKIIKMGLNNHTKYRNNLKKREWEKEEIEYLKENYAKTPMKEIMVHLNRGEMSIRRKASHLNIANKVIRWDSEKEKILKEYWGSVSLSTLIKKTNMSENALYNKARQLNLGPIWSNGSTYLTTDEIFELIDIPHRTFYGYLYKNIIEHKVFRKKYSKKRGKYLIKIDSFLLFLENYPTLYKLKEEGIFYLKSITSEVSISDKDIYINDIPDWLKDKIKNNHRTSSYRKAWTTKEKKLLNEYIEKGYTPKEISEMMDRTLNSIYGQIKTKRN